LLDFEKKKRKTCRKRYAPTSIHRWRWRWRRGTNSSSNKVHTNQIQIGSKVVNRKYDNDTFDIESNDRKPTTGTGSPHSNYYHKIVHHLRQRWYQSSRQRIITFLKSSNVLYMERKYTIIAVLVIVFLLLFVLSIYVWNDRITLYIDQSLQEQYIQYLLYQQQYRNNRLHSLFPNVVIKATRKVEKHHYSFYLYEIINHYYTKGNKNSINEYNTIVPVPVPVPVPVANRNVDRTTTSSFMVLSPRTVNSLIQIHGIDQINHALQLKKSNHTTSTKKSKSNINQSITIIDQIQHWFCELCLRTGYAGSYYNCQYLCSFPKVQQVYFPHTIPTREDGDGYDTKQLVESVQVSYSIIASSNNNNNNNLNQTDQHEQHQPQHQQQEQNQYHIPKIIHQVYDVPITTLLYPELVRIQNTWRTQTGYQYHFYTFTEQKQFIQQYYPIIVYDIYEAMIIDDTYHYQRRIHFFQLLVLYQFGGIYANLDVLLEVHLNAIIQQNEDNNVNRNNNYNVSLIVIRNPNLLLQRCIDTIFMAAIYPVILLLLL
jgi:hypothetical protein